MTKHVGRTFVVTGAARSIGQAVAQRIAHEGGRLAVLDVLDLSETEQLLAEAGVESLCIKADLASETDVASAYSAINDRFGPVDGIVNVAGIMPETRWEDIDYALWRRVHAVNVDSMFFMCKQFVPDMQAKGWGRIVNFASGIVRTATPNRVPYRTTKAAIIGFTRGLAVELAQYNITANSVTPSVVMTEGTGQGFAERQDFVPPAQLLKRPQRPEDIAGLVSFLLSEDAAFITGQMMHADGGLVMR